MKVVRGIADFVAPARPVALTLGFFDGVHRGHQALLRQLLQTAARINGVSVVLTFDSHPFRVVCPDKLPPVIMTLTERLHHLERMGIDHVVVQSFDREFAEINADYFIRELLLHRLRARAIVGGYDTSFGRNREGDHEMLRAYSRTCDYEFEDVPPMKDGDTIISSTVIRRAIQRGALEETRRMLGRPWTIWSHVVEGRGVGRTMGFPTANLHVGYLVMPRSGVYAAYVHVGNAVHRGLLYVGTQPTFGRAQPDVMCEVYLMDFAGDLYDEYLRVEPVVFMRDDMTFDSPTALQAQIEADVAGTYSLLEDPHERPACLSGSAD